MLIFSRAIISTDWSPAVRWWRWRCGSEWWWARVSYFRFVSVGLQNARDCRAELSYAVYQQTGLNQPTYLVFADMLTQYLNNALWSSYVTQTTDRGSSGSHCSRPVVVTSSETRMTGVRVTVHFCLAIIIMVQPSSRHTISSHYTAWPQHTAPAHWTVIPNKQAEYAAPVCHAPLRWHPPDVARAGPGLRIATLRHYQWLHDH